MDQSAARKIVENALGRKDRALNEYEAKKVLSSYDIPVTREMLARSPKELERAAQEIGFPLVLKACSAELAHKTEKNLVRVDVRSPDEAAAAFEEIIGQIPDKDENSGVLVQEMLSGKRELVIGMTRDPQFGPCIMFGLGGIFTEILKDIAFRKAPIDKDEAFRLMQDIQGRRILESVRGMPAADTDILANMLIQVGNIGLDMDAVAEIDINPVILTKSSPVAADALMVLSEKQ
ncbi:MAG: acetate--CoA ligase family protein [Desulfosalsimonas sp.]